MTLPEVRRGFPTYRSASGAEPARVAAREVDSRGFGISYDDVGQGSTVVLRIGTGARHKPSEPSSTSSPDSITGLACPTPIGSWRSSSRS